MTQIPSQEFFETLGQYVYCYKDPITDGITYIGKGNDKRSISHIKTKGYELDNCWIVARNLERFENKTDWQSFLLESYMINYHNPIDNSVSGHYKECFIMAKLSDLFAEYQSSQYDNFSEFPSWYVENYSKFKGRLNIFTIKSDNIYLESSTRYGLQMSWYYYVNSENKPFTVKFSNWAKEEKYEENKTKLFNFLVSEGIDEKTIVSVGNRGAFEVDLPGIEEAINLFDKFMS